MTVSRNADATEFVVPARTLRGSREIMLADIDQAITGLLALRHLISGDAPAPAPARREGRARRPLHDLGEVLGSFRRALQP